MDLAIMEDASHSRVEFRTHQRKNKIIIQGLLVANTAYEIVHRLTGHDFCIEEGIRLVTEHNCVSLYPSPYIARIGAHESSYIRIDGFLDFVKTVDMVTLLRELGLKDMLHADKMREWTCHKHDPLGPEFDYGEYLYPNYIMDDERFNAEFSTEEHDNIIGDIDDQDLIHRSSHY